MTYLGLFLMTSVILMLCYKVLTAKGGYVEFDLVEVIVIPLVWIAGRYVAGKSILDFLLN